MNGTRPDVLTVLVRGGMRLACLLSSGHARYPTPPEDPDPLVRIPGGAQHHHHEPRLGQPEGNEHWTHPWAP